MVASKNKATGGLFTWITATIQCYDIFKDVEPKRKLAEEMKKLKAKSQQELAQTEAQLKEVTEMLEGLNSKKKIKQDELDELQAKSNEMTRKLNAASKLINGLASE
jgi:dynein heavy chain